MKRGKFKLKINKVIKYEVRLATSNVLRDVATGQSREKIDLNLRDLETHMKMKL
jgi:hypothetical protein